MTFLELWHESCYVLGQTQTKQQKVTRAMKEVVRTDTTYTNIAVPYYGSMARPGRGFESIYILASTCAETGIVEDTRVETWTGRSARELAAWLADKKVSGIIADGFSLALEKALQSLNIWSHQEAPGEVHEVIERHWRHMVKAA